MIKQHLRIMICKCYFIIRLKRETYAVVSRQQKMFDKLIERARRAKT